MEYEFGDDEVEIYFLEQDEIIDPSNFGEFEGPPLYPDPLLIAAITCLFCLVIFGGLLKLSYYVFGSVTSDTLIVQSNDTNADHQSQEETQAWDGECAVSTHYPPKITRWCHLITQYSTKHNLDPDLIAALIWLESGGNELAYSHSGAVGLMQVMPRDGLAASFMCANGPCFRDRPTSDELRDPEYNIAFGTRYLSSLLRRNDNLREALKSYGPMDAGYSYSDKVLNIFNQYKNN